MYRSRILRETVNLPTKARAVVHHARPEMSEGRRDAVILVAGAGGGIDGPAGMYDALSNRLAGSGVTAMRVDYRRPNQLEPCVDDVRAAVQLLNEKEPERPVERVVLVGWSFGGAVVITAGARLPEVVGVATVASQTAGCEDVGRLGPRKALLLLHGTGDTCLPPRCSQQLYERAQQPKDLVLFDRDNHGLTQHVPDALNKLTHFALGLFGKQEHAP